MTNANIALMTPNNTFQDWVTQSNNMANVLNSLLNGLLYCDNGNLTLANGQIQLLHGSGTLLSVSGNVTISQNATIGGVTVTSNTTTGNLLVQANTQTGNLTVAGKIFASNTAGVTEVGNTWTVNIGSQTIVTIGGSSNSGQTSNNAVAVRMVTGNLSAGSLLIEFAGGDNSNGTNSFGLVTVSNNLMQLLHANATGVIQFANASGNLGNVTTIAASLYLANGTWSVTGNGAFANVIATMNTTTGNLSVKQNASIGNLTVSANTVGGNASYANINVSGIANLGTLVVGAITSGSINATGTINVSSNAAFGNTSVTGNLVVSMNSTTGNLSVTVNAVTGNLNVSKTANITGGLLVANDIQLDSAGTYSILQGNAVFNNVTIQGTQTIEGTTTLASDTFQLRTGSAADGDGHFKTFRGATVAANSDVKFNHTSGVMQFAANDAQTYSTILTAANIADSISNNGTTAVASANAVETAYNLAFVANTTAAAGYGQANAAYAQANLAYAQANTQGTYANGGLVVANTSNINFNNSATLNVNITANGTQTNVNLTANITAITGPYATIANTTFGVINAAITAANANALAAYAEANSAANTVATFHGGTVVLAAANLNFNDSQTILGTITANGTTQTNISLAVNTNLSITSLTLSGNLAAGNGSFSGNLTALYTKNTVLANTADALNNVGSINGPNTAVLNVALTNAFDITTANVGFQCINISFASWATTGNMQTVTVIVRQPGAAPGNTAQTSANLVNWTNSQIVWSNGEVPVLAGFKGKCDILTFVTVDGGTHIYGAHSMANVG